MDGERIILSEALGPDIIEDMKSIRADLAKGGPSVTGSHQPCDVSSNFRVWREAIKKISRNSTTFTNDVLSANVNKAIEKLTADANLQGKLAADWKRKVVSSALKITQVMSNGGLNPKRNAEGFTITGQHIERETIKSTATIRSGILENANKNQNVAMLGKYGNPECTVDFHRIMNKCLTKQTVESENIIIENIPKMVAFAIVNGTVTDAYMDEIGIPKLQPDQHINRDNKVIQQKHACVLTNEYTLREFRDYLQAREDRLNPENIEQQRLDKEAEKIIKNNRKNQEKKDKDEAAKVLKDQNLLADRERFKALSKEEQKEEKKLINERKAVEKKRKNDEKAIKEHKNMQRLEEAQNRNRLRLARDANANV